MPAHLTQRRKPLFDEPLTVWPQQHQEPLLPFLDAEEKERAAQYLVDNQPPTLIGAESTGYWKAINALRSA
jgi:hypothetical protein